MAEWPCHPAIHQFHWKIDNAAIRFSFAAQPGLPPWSGGNAVTVLNKIVDLPLALTMNLWQ
jgi:hypothetical protein